MAAKDYEFCESSLTGNVYLAKRIKSKALMSQDRRIVTDKEIIGMFESYLRRFCKTNNVDTVMIRDEIGKLTFTATLNDKER